MAERVLLVEGKNDKHVVMALLAKYAVPEQFKIEIAGDVNTLIASVPVWLKGSGIERVAVVIDADESIEGRWNAIRDRINRAGAGTLPAQPQGDGTVVELVTGQRFGVWLMPDNTVPGILEHFVAFLIPEHDALLPHVDAFLAAIPPADQLFPQQHLAKARLHSWLAIQKEPGKPMGQAITATYLKGEQPAASTFVEWITRTLVDE